MCTDNPIQINLQAVLTQKLGTKARWIPRWLVSRLQRTICQDELNRLLRDNHPATGANFCKGVLKDLNISVTEKGTVNLPASPRFILVSNHPLGGLDGMALISLLKQHYGIEPLFIVNDILMAVEPLRCSFLPINKHGAQSRDTLMRIHQAMKSDTPIIIFPAGLVSRRGKGGLIRDLQWHKMFIQMAHRYHRDIVPAHFSGHNSDSFYKLAQRRKRIGIPFNIEMIYLPREVIQSAGKTYAVTYGLPIPWTALNPGPEAAAQAEEIKKTVYAL